MQKLRTGQLGKDFIISIIGIGVWSTILFVTNIIVGRLLGPEEYGRYALTLSVASIMFIPMILGFNTSMIKYGASLQDKEKSTLLSTSLISVVFLISITTMILIYFRSPLSTLFHISPKIWTWAIVLAIGLTAQYLGDSLFRSYHAFKGQSTWLVISAITLFAALFFMFRYLSIRTFILYVIAMIIGYGLIFIGGIKLFLAKYVPLSPFVSLVQFYRLSHFGLYAVLGSIIGTLMMNVDRLMINYFISEQAVGMYMAYTIAATMILLKLTEMFINVFFPAISAFDMQQKARIFYRLRRFVYYFFAPCMVITMGIMTVTFFLFGNDYKIVFTLFFLFSIQAVLLSASTIMVWFVNSLDMKWVSHFTKFGFFLVILNIAGNTILIPIFKLHGAVVTTIGVYLIYYLYAQYRLSRILPVYASV